MSQLNVRVEELSPVVRRLQIQVPAERVVDVTNQVYTRLGRTVKLKGYRPGHVPRHILERYFSDRVRSDVAREIVDATFEEALGTTDLMPVAAPTVEPEEVKLGEDFRYSARVEVRPDVKVESWKGLAVKVVQKVIADAEVEKHIEELRENMTTLAPIEDRDTVELGDVASISYEVTIDGRSPEKRDDALVRVEPGLFVDGHGEKLVGAKIGESREFVESFSDDAGESLSGKAAQIKVTLKALKRRETPALDDEFAKDAGGVGSLDELRAKVRADLQARADQENAGARRQAVLEALVERNPLEVPPALVEESANRIAVDFAMSLIRRGLNVEPKSPIFQQLREDAKPRALFDVKSTFLLDAVAKAEKLEVTPAEVEAQIARMAKEEGVPLEQVKARFRKPQQLNQLGGNVRLEKAYTLVEQSASISIEEKASAVAAG